MLRYIKGTINYGLVFNADGNDPILCGYSDADWGGGGGDLETRHRDMYFKYSLIRLVGVVEGNHQLQDPQLKQNI